MFALILLLLLFILILSLALNLIIFTDVTLIQVERIEINKINAALPFTGTHTDIADVHVVLVGVLERVEDLDITGLLLLRVMSLRYFGLI